MSRRPACMSDAEWFGWSEANEGRVPRLRNIVPVQTPCVDCLDAFATEMRSQDRCDGRPLAWRHPTGGSWTEERRAQWRAYKQRVRTRDRQVAS